MRRLIQSTLLCFFATACLAWQPELKPHKSLDVGLPKVSLSVNPLGALFFGPTVDLSLGLNSQTLVYANARFTSLGLMSYYFKRKRIDEEMYSLSGLGFGAGVSRFLDESGSGVYYGAQVGYDKLSTSFEEDEAWEWYEDVKSFVIGGNGGYRVPIGSNFYINAGGFAGIVYSNYTWDYYDKVYGQVDPEERGGTTLFFVGMAELAVGIVIK